MSTTLGYQRVCEVSIGSFGVRKRKGGRGLEVENTETKSNRVNCY
jgi:hypothetical protein